MNSDSKSVDEQSKQSIKAVSDLEHEALARRTTAEAFSDFVVSQGGRPWVIAVHALWFGGWMLWNSGRVPGIRAFDPFPYMGLTTIVSLEAIFSSLFILVSQNRATRRAARRDRHPRYSWLGPLHRLRDRSWLDSPAWESAEPLGA
jgi:uncharacterized membrane protein